CQFFGIVAVRRIAFGKRRRVHENTRLRSGIFTPQPSDISRIRSSHLQITRAGFERASRRGEKSMAGADLSPRLIVASACPIAIDKRGSKNELGKFNGLHGMPGEEDE